MTSFTVKGDDSEKLVKAIDFITQLPTNKDWDITISEHKEKRSTAQNKLYWLWIGEISDQLTTLEGEKLSRERWHYLCGMKFLGIDSYKVNGCYHSMPAKSTTKLNTKEFSDYLHEIEADFLARGVVLTFPDHYGLAMGKK